MNQRVLIAIPLASLLAYLAIAILSHGDPLLTAIAITSMKALAFTGCLAAAWRYRRSDYLFWAWLLLSLDYGSLAINDLLLGRRFHLLNINDAHLSQQLRTWIIVASNFAAAISAIMMARTWRVAGLGLTSSLWQKLIVILGILVAVAVVGWITWPTIDELRKGAGGSWVAIAANTGDLICFCVIAPLFLQTMALRGGTLAWPWAFIVGSDIAWMIFDVLINVGVTGKGRIVAEGFRVFACALAMSAGLAQRWAIKASRRGGAGLMDTAM